MKNVTAHILSFKSLNFIFYFLLYLYRSELGENVKTKGKVLGMLNIFDRPKFVSVKNNTLYERKLEIKEKEEEK